MHVRTKIGNWGECVCVCVWIKCVSVCSLLRYYSAICCQ